MKLLGYLIMSCTIFIKSFTGAFEFFVFILVNLNFFSCVLVRLCFWSIRYVF